MPTFQLKKNDRVVTVKLAVVEPAGTVTLEGTLLTSVLFVLKVTCAPPVGAGPLSVTVPRDEVPPLTVVGVSDSEVSVIVAAAGPSASPAVLLTPL